MKVKFRIIGWRCFNRRYSTWIVHLPTGIRLTVHYSKQGITRMNCPSGHDLGSLSGIGTLDRLVEKSFKEHMEQNNRKEN
ncbi:MAG: hypothetical protein ACXADB_05360 [Candidatus Hermodarchaeia archaeon]|jgi:hypothetical protein